MLNWIFQLDKHPSHTSPECSDLNRFIAPPSPDPGAFNMRGRAICLIALADSVLAMARHKRIITPHKASQPSPKYLRASHRDL